MNLAKHLDIRNLSPILHRRKHNKNMDKRYKKSIGRKGLSLSRQKRLGMWRRRAPQKWKIRTCWSETRGRQPHWKRSQNIESTGCQDWHRENERPLFHDGADRRWNLRLHKNRRRDRSAYLCLGSVNNPEMQKKESWRQWLASRFFFLFILLIKGIFKEYFDNLTHYIPAIICPSA